MNKINSIKLRDYFVAQYWKKFNKRYISKSTELDHHLLKNLIDKYGGDLVLLAMDTFFKETQPDKISINYFSTSSFFESRYQLLIRAKAIIKYKEFLVTHIDYKMKELVDEYVDYANALFLSQGEINRKQEILLELEKLYNEHNL